MAIIFRSLKAAGFSDEQLYLFAVPEKRQEGGLVATWPGTSKTLKPLLLIAHIDVVAAKREDWVRDPFTLIEEDGYFYGRGALDVKWLAAGLVDTLIRFQKTGYKPGRTVKIALTCGEETNGAFNGVEWLAANKRELIDAEFALNEGGGGATPGGDPDGGGDGTPAPPSASGGPGATTISRLSPSARSSRTSLGRRPGARATMT